jgi:hypothetical protein
MTLRSGYSSTDQVFMTFDLDVFVFRSDPELSQFTNVAFPVIGATSANAQFD